MKSDLLSSRLIELSRLFLKLGVISFGGPAAHIALMEETFVRRLRWLTAAEFLDLVGAVNLIPGPNSTELAIHIGYRRAGIPGLLTAGICFILPAFVMVLFLVWTYVRYGSLPEFSGLLHGVKPVVLAVIVQALWNLGRAALKTRLLAGLAAAAAVFSLYGVHEISILLTSGIFIMFMKMFRDPRPGGLKLMSAAPSTVSAVVSGAVASSAAYAQPGLLFWIFFKTGALLFGSGYVLLAFLRSDLVERLGWITEAQLLDAVAVGQVTPGPVFTAATFIGYLLSGFEGACLATLGIFLPAFVFVALSVPWLPRLRKSKELSAFLDGVNAASLALMAAVTALLAAGGLHDFPSLVVLAVSFLLLTRFRVHSFWLILAGAAVGLALGV